MRVLISTYGYTFLQCIGAVSLEKPALRNINKEWLRYDPLPQMSYTPLVSWPQNGEASLAAEYHYYDRKPLNAYPS